MNDDKKVALGLLIFLGMCAFSTLLFCGLRIAKAVDWHWFWLISPLLIPLVVIGIVASVAD